MISPTKLFFVYRNQMKDEYVVKYIHTRRDGTYPLKPMYHADFAFSLDERSNSVSVIKCRFSPPNSDWQQVADLIRWAKIVAKHDTDS